MTHRITLAQLSKPLQNKIKRELAARTHSEKLSAEEIRGLTALRKAFWKQPLSTLNDAYNNFDSFEDYLDGFLDEHTSLWSETAVSFFREGLKNELLPVFNAFAKNLEKMSIDREML